MTTLQRLTIVCLLTVSCGPANAQTGANAVDKTVSGAESPYVATVAGVVDGDTIEINLADGRTEIVRLLGIDTPETVHPTKPVQCFGPQASAAIKTLLPPGTSVRIERDIEPRDAYDRLLLYVYRSDDDMFINNWLIENGYADELGYEPNTTHQATFLKSRSKARATLLAFGVSAMGQTSLSSVLVERSYCSQQCTGVTNWFNVALHVCNS